jgi:ATP-dependent RNA helicase DeaD
MDINFEEMDISGQIKSALREMGFTEPTPVQKKVIPLILEGRDCVALAPTGTGKTCGFGIPIIERCELSLSAVQSIILCPTRELAVQIEKELKQVAAHIAELKICAIYGGQNIDRQLSALRRGVHIVVGTPGRVMDHLKRKSLKLDALKTLILDEVDEMLNMGFREDIDFVLSKTPAQIQKVFFSATMPEEIIKISQSYQNNPAQVEVRQLKQDMPKIEQFVVEAQENEKIAALIEIIKQNDYRLVLVFVNTKRRADELGDELGERGLLALSLHGDLRQRERDKVMQAFRTGGLNVLVATDVAARGIDVSDIQAVFNFDIPREDEYYIHRIGRTGRANKSGCSYTFASKKQMFEIRNLERYTKTIMKEYNYKNGGAAKPQAAAGGEAVAVSVTGQAATATDLRAALEQAAKNLDRTDLSEYKKQIELKLNELSNAGARRTATELAAALLCSLAATTSRQTVATTATAPEDFALKSRPVESFKQRKSEKNPSGGLSGGKVAGGVSKDFRTYRQPDGVKFFLNIGFMDRATEDDVRRFITDQTSVIAADIIEIKLLETFSFATVLRSAAEEMKYLNGARFNKRVVACEKASPPKGRGNSGGVRGAGNGTGGGGRANANTAKATAGYVAGNGGAFDRLAADGYSRAADSTGDFGTYFDKGEDKMTDTKKGFQNKKGGAKDAGKSGYKGGFSKKPPVRKGGKNI